MYQKEKGIRGALSQIVRDLKKKLSKSDLTADFEMKSLEIDDWQVYLNLSNKIAQANKVILENIHPKPPKIISIDDGELVTHAKSLQFPGVKTPKVSIIIPVLNNEKLTIECLASILKNTVEVPYEIILIDDGSTEKMQEIMSHIRNITYIKNTNNLSFLLSCNHAAEKARGEFILFLIMILRY